MVKILLVEDNEMNRDMLSRRLTRKNFEVITAENGNEGVAKTRTDNPDVILMDVNLPDIDGWEATRQLKKDESTQHIPIIALTAHAMSSDRDKSFDAGCDEYETKPVKFKQLLEKIQFVLDKAKSG